MSACGGFVIRDALDSESHRQSIFSLETRQYLPCNESILFPNTTNLPRVLWLQAGHILFQTADQFTTFTKTPARGFGYAHHSQKRLDRLYFFNHRPLVQYLPKSNRLVLCGMAHNSVGTGNRTHSDCRSAITLWNTLTGDLTWAFFPEYQFGSFYRIIISPGERYAVVSQLYEGEDTYVLDLQEQRLILKTQGRLAFFLRSDKVVFLSSCGRDGWNGGIRVLDLKSQQERLVISETVINALNVDFRDVALSMNESRLYSLIDYKEPRLVVWDVSKLLDGQFAPFEHKIALPLEGVIFEYRDDPTRMQVFSRTDKPIRSDGCLILDEIHERLLYCDANGNITASRIL
jgi:hypothetical protein